MSNALSPPGRTLAEFLAWEAAQPDKWEFDGGRPAAMTGGSFAHAVIQVNLLAGEPAGR